MTTGKEPPQPCVSKQPKKLIPAWKGVRKDLSRTASESKQRGMRPPLKPKHPRMRGRGRA